MDKDMIVTSIIDPELEVGIAIDKGPREENQDAASASGRRVGVFDGLGGHGAGDQASRAAAQALIGVSPQETLTGAMRASHVAVLAAQDAADVTCLTTAVIAEVQGGKVMLAWTGDSRAYVSRPDGIEQVTRDHGYGHFVSKCLGHARDWMPELETARFGPGDILLLCTDGLYRAVTDPRIQEVVRRMAPLTEIAQNLVDEALAAGTTDNVTALVLRRKL